MDPSAWPANMRDYHLRQAAREAYWQIQDCERAVEGPLVNIGGSIAMAIVALFVVGWWSLVGLPVLVVFCRGCYRQSKAARPALEEAKADLEALRARGAKVCL